MSPLVIFIFFYIIAFIYVREPHYKYIGYIMLAIVYILSVIVTIQNRDLFWPAIINIFPKDSTFPYEKALFIVLFAIVFFTLFSIIKVIDAYSDAASKKKSFDLKLSQRNKNFLAAYENSFIVGNVFMAVALLVLAINPNNEMPFSTSGITTRVGKLFENIDNKVIIYLGVLVPFICVWIQFGNAWQFSKIKNN